MTARGVVRRVRLATGLVLFAFLLTQFANRSLGLISLAAARHMAANLDEMNRSLAHDLPAPLGIGIGINFGAAIVGEMGYGRATSITAAGDPVNAASRLEALCKDYDCQLVLAEEAALGAGIDVAGFDRHEVQIRGRADATAMRVVPDARDLPPLTASGNAS